ncbi:hypothetical protein [Cysteiniphilum halobium]|uniref:hypothetical protein n=1 Tax=Cysteiniphilum halobium TaxID=2219059 RepID=UPI000E65B1BA|nr:hypothetical protein [Cysteiniphilum halobium]
MADNIASIKKADTKNGDSPLERFKVYLSEQLQNKEAVILSEYYAFATTKRFVDTGLIGLIQEVTAGLLPIYIALDILQFSHIKEKLETQGVSSFIIFEDKANIKQDQLASEKLIDFDWQPENIYECVKVISKMKV